jgi:transposase InsO family protein
MRTSYGITYTLKAMGLKRAGYYKWLRRQGQPNRHELRRQLVSRLIEEIHQQHRSYGYHSIGQLIRQRHGWQVSDLLIHRCAKPLGIRSQARHYRFQKPGHEHLIYPNRIQGVWNAQRPLEVVTSDMTILRNRGVTYEWTYMIDTFNNEIIASSVSSQTGDPRPYFDCLDQLKTQLKGANHPTILHTDQGTIYSSRAFSQAHAQYNIQRSMSRSGTPTDNPIIEAINGWVKEELRLDFNLRHTDDLRQTLNHYITYYNHDRTRLRLKL